MKRRKKLQELTIKDNFMFGAVMCDEKNCKKFLEMALGFPIAKVEVSKENIDTHFRTNVMSCRSFHQMMEYTRYFLVLKERMKKKYQKNQ